MSLNYVHNEIFLQTIFIGDKNTSMQISRTQFINKNIKKRAVVNPAYYIRRIYVILNK